MPRRRESVSRRFNRMMRSARRETMEYRTVELDIKSLYPSLFLNYEQPLNWDEVYEIFFPDRKLKRFLASISQNDPQNAPNFNVLEKGK